jgi:hypothetical protein
MKSPLATHTTQKNILYELYVLYCSPHIIQVIKTRRMRWAGHVAHMGGAYRVSLGTAEGKRQPGRPKRRWEDNIKMDLQDMEWTA